MQMDERLSAAIDNELTAEDCHELVDELAQQPALQRAWERQHAVNALLRGEQIGTSNAVSWDRLQDAFQSRSSSPRIKGKKARIVDFKYFCTQHAAKWAGGTALAASVLLGVSLLSTLYRPSFGTQVPFASEATPSSPPMSQFATANQIPRSHVQTTDLTTNSQTNEYLAAEQKKREIPSNQPNSRTLPSNQPPHDLVRLVSDKPN